MVMLMKKTILTLAVLMLLTTSAFAAHGGKHVTVGLNGLVCDYCAQSMKKIFGKQDPVSAVEVDLTKKTMTLDIKKGAELSDDAIRKGVTDAGYTVTGITRD